MTRIVRTETRKRGFFGKLIKWSFIGFNVLMAVWLFAGLGGAGDVYNNASGDAERAGAAIGTAIGGGFVLFIWVAGAVILGLLTLLSRGKKVIVEESEG